MHPELYPMFIDKKRIAQEQEFTNSLHEFLDQQDYWHSFKHVQRVVAFAKEINRYEDRDITLIELGASLHQLHDPNLDKLKVMLDKSSLNKEYRDHLYEIVEACRPDKISHLNSIEARIIFDADALDLQGPSGFLREFACNVEIRNYDMEYAVNKALDVQELFRSKLQTSRARMICDQMSNVTKEFVDSFRRNEEYMVQIKGLKY